jgi:hypothetical protein
MAPAQSASSHRPRAPRQHDAAAALRRGAAWLAPLLLVAACSKSPREPIPITPAKDAPTAAVSRRPAEPPPPVVASTTPPAAAVVVVPADAIYVCVSGTGASRKETVIEYAPKVDSLCRKHPEMGPCQYERDICRQSGGRVYAAGGVEITMQTEAEYDKKVMRVRFKAN